MKRCLYSKCGKEFEPNKPKQKFCCDIHRVYYSRENRPKIQIKDLTKPNEVAPPKQKKTNFVAVVESTPKEVHKEVAKSLDILEQIEADKKEIETLPKEGQWASIRKNFLERRIQQNQKLLR